MQDRGNAAGRARRCRRTAVRGVLLAGAVVTAAAGTAAAAPHRSARLTPVTLTIAVVPPKMIFMGFYVAKQKGFFAKNGLDVTLMAEQGGVQAARAVAAGDAYFEAGGTDAIAASAAQNGGLEAVWSYGQNDLSLIADKSIHSVAQLKGKKVGLGDPTGPAYELTSFALRKDGLPISAVDNVILNSRAALVGALADNEIQASAFHIDDGYTVLEKDPNVRVLEPLYKVAPLYWYGAVGVPGTYARQNPGTVVAFLKSMIEAQRWMYAHRAQTIALSVKDTEESPTVVAKSYDFLTANKLWSTTAGMTAAQVNWTMRQYKLNGIINRIPPNSQVFDLRYVDEALAQLKS